MKDPKKCSLTLNIALLVPLWLGLTAMASAQKQGVCSANRLAGQAGFTATGTVILQTGPVPFAIVGKVTSQADGTLTGTQTASLGGSVSHETSQGALTLNPDCTGTMTVDIHDESGTLPDRTAVWFVVVDDNAKEMRSIMTSLVLHLPGGDVSTPAIVTMNTRKLLPGSANAQ
jgi:hypothetical protein